MPIDTGMHLNHFHHLSFEWRLGGLTVCRDRAIMLEISRCSSISLALVADERTETEHSALLRLRAARFEWLLFVNFDGIQTNMREVSPELGSLSEVYDWLLPPGYVSRQGDVGVYRIGSSDDTLSGIPDDLAEHGLHSVLKGRHTLSGGYPRRYFDDRGSVIVKIGSAMRIQHPEHLALDLCAGSYKLLAAKGVVYPMCQNTRPFRGAPVLC